MTQRPLPPGLAACATCGEARGSTPDGRVAACICQGVVCTWCGARARRPISDHYDRRSGWLHTPHFILMGHGCPAPPEARVGKQWVQLPADEAVTAYQAEMTRLARAEIERWARRGRGPRRP